VRIVNEAAGWRPGEDPSQAPTHGEETKRLPKLLPGINLLHGLKGETRETYELNEQFLHQVYDAGLMLRRVNIRQVMAFDGTEMSETGSQIAKDHKKLFKQYKTRVREEIDRPMLRRVAPAGTRLPDVHLEYHQDGKTFGRQLGTYPLLVAIPGEHELGRTLDVAVTDHGFRSVSGVPYPLDVNAASMDELTAIPGLGKQRAGNLVVDRPFDALADAEDRVETSLADFAEVRSPEGAD